MKNLNIINSTNTIFYCFDSMIRLRAVSLGSELCWYHGTSILCTSPSATPFVASLFMDSTEPYRFRFPSDLSDLRKSDILQCYGPTLLLRALLDSSGASLSGTIPVSAWFFAQDSEKKCSQGQDTSRKTKSIRLITMNLRPCSSR